MGTEIQVLLQEVKEMRQEIRDLILVSKPNLTFTEFCKFASISEHRGRVLTKQGMLPFCRPFGKKLYISREDAIAVLKRNPIQTAAAVDKKVIQYLLTTKSAA